MKYFKTLSIGSMWGSSALIWDYYGYSNKPFRDEPNNLPSWCDKKYIATAKTEAKKLKEPNLKVKILWNKRKQLAQYSIYDANNLRIEPFTVNCSWDWIQSKEKLLAHAKIELHNTKHLSSESIRCLMHFAKTGIPCKENWLNNSIDEFGYKLVNGKIIKNKIPKREELEIKAVC